MGNPAGNLSLATALVAGELARWFGLVTPPFAIVQVVDIDIPMEGYGFMDKGPAFVSRELEGAPGDGGDIFLSRLNNPDDVSKLVIFDTWIRNADRCSPDPEVPFNRDNLFFTPIGRKFDLVVFDHSHCFVETTLEAELEGGHLLDDARIYGNFPEFSRHLNGRAIEAGAARLHQIDAGVAQEIIGSIPADWGITTSVKTAWADLILRRAQKVADYVPLRLMDQQCFKF
jgi:hypothetical protein